MASGGSGQGPAAGVAVIAAATTWLLLPVTRCQHLTLNRVKLARLAPIISCVHSCHDFAQSGRVQERVVVSGVSDDGGGMGE